MPEFHRASLQKVLLRAPTSWKLPWVVSTPFACLTVGKGASGWAGSSGQGGAPGYVQLGGTCLDSHTSLPRRNVPNVSHGSRNTVVSSLATPLTR